MIKLRRLLLCDYLFYIFLVCAIIYALFACTYKEQSIYEMKDNIFYGRVVSIKDGEQNEVIIKNREKLLVRYDGDINFELGDYISVEGDLSSVKNNTVFNLFNYRKYLYSKKIYWIIDPRNINFIQKNNKISYKIKNYVIYKIDGSENREYLYAFILGNNNYIDEEFLNSYKVNGIIHLFAVSGMHIGFISLAILFILKRSKILEMERYIITSLFLIFYMFLTGFSASVNRSCILFFLLFLNNIFYLNIKPQNILIFIFSIFLIINPYLLYDIGFQFSYVISFFLIINIDYICSIKDYILKLLFTSTIAFLASFPILVNNFFEVNFLSILLNIFFIPLISIVIFPLSLITFIFPIFNPLLKIFITVFESISLFVSEVDLLVFSFGKIHIIFIFLYYIILIVMFNYKKWKLVFCIVCFYLMVYFSSYLNSSAYIAVLDVGQGDSIFIHYPYNKLNILVDTGGNYYDSSIAENKIIPFLKSVGVKKLDYLIISHGDCDHICEATDLIDNFDVKKIIINANKFNSLENALIVEAELKGISVIQLENEIKFYLENKVVLYSVSSNNENNSSIVMYFILNNRKIFLSGDIEEKVENKIINSLNISNIDILKVPHHGSLTSSNISFINKLRPKYSVISVGANNNFGHPSSIILERLQKYSVINLTSTDGSVKYNIYKTYIEVNTCSP